MNLLPLHNSWPLSDTARHFELGHVLRAAVTDVIEPIEVGALGFYHAGSWECDLKDNSLLWSRGVFDIFGLPRDIRISRDETLPFYAEESRAKLERLRAYAIKHKRGFTLDAQVLPAAGNPRWMRLIAAPILDGDKVVRMHGLKLVL